MPEVTDNTIELQKEHSEMASEGYLELCKILDQLELDDENSIEINRKILKPFFVFDGDEEFHRTHTFGNAETTSKKNIKRKYLELLFQLKVTKTLETFSLDEDKNLSIYNELRTKLRSNPEDLTQISLNVIKKIIQDCITEDLDSQFNKIETTLNGILNTFQTNKYRGSIKDLPNDIQQKVETLCQKLESISDQKEALNNFT